MNKNLKIPNIIVLALVLLVALAMPVLAQTYYADVVFSETSGNSYDMFPARTAFNTDYMASEGYVNSTALDTRILEGTNAIPHMMADNKLLFATNLPANSSKTLTFTIGNSLLSAFDIITGRGGYITTADNATLEVAGNFTIEHSGWVDTTAVSSNLTLKEDAFRTYISATGNITSTANTTSVTASGVSSGEHIVTTSANITHLRIAIDGTIEDTAVLTANVTDNANDWVWNQNNVMLYAEYIEIWKTIRVVETLRPNAIGSETSIDFSTSGNHHLDVDEVVADEGATVVYLHGLNLNWTRDLYNLPASSGSDPINFVRIYFRVWSDFANALAKPSLKSNGTVTDGTQVGIVEDTWTTFSEQWSTNPADSQPWEWADIDALEIGVSLKNGTDRAYCTQVYVEVDSTPLTTLELRYRPNTYIVGNVLPDLAGTAQDGTITWGVNDTGVSVIVGSLVAYAEAAGVDPEVGAGEAVGEVRAPGGLFPSEVRMKATLHFLYPAMKIFADATDFPVQFFWWFGSALMTICAMVATMKWLPNIWWVGVVGVFALGMGVGQAFLPGFFIILGVLAVIFAVITERTPSI